MLEVVLLDKGTIREDIIIPKFNFENNFIKYDNTLDKDVEKRIINSDIVISNKVKLNSSNLKNCKKLKLVAIAATGTNHVDIEYCNKNKIGVVNVKNYSTNSVVEHCFCLIFELVRKTNFYQKEILNGNWEKSEKFCIFTYPFSDISGRTLGIIGNGAIGLELGKRASAFGIKVSYLKRNDNYLKFPNLNFLEFEDLLKQSDIISINCPLNNETKDLIKITELKKMKPTAIIINTSRGGIINEKDLAEAITKNIISGAGIDTTTEEPISKKHHFFNLVSTKNFILTPHIAWASKESMQLLCQKLVSNINNYVLKIN